MPTPKTKITSRIANATLGDVGNALSRLVYRISRNHAISQVAAEVGARQASIAAIAEAKAYDEIGGTEIATYLNSQFTNQPKTNLDILAALYETHPWVKICTSYIATSLAGVPLRVWKAKGFEGGKEILEPDDDGDVGRMFRWINPSQSPGEFVEDLTSWLILCGEAFVVFAQPGPGTPLGIPAEMYVLFTPFVEKVVSPRLGLLGYRYNVGGEEAYFDVKDVAYFKTFSPAGRFRGQGAATAGYQTIRTDQELRAFNQKVLTQGVHLSGVLETDNEDLNREGAELIRKSFESQYAGSQKASKVAVLWGGLKFSPQTILQKDIMMSEQVAANRDEICALFGLKPELLTEKFSNKATAETVRRMAYEDTILGRWGARIESVLSSTGLMRFDPDLRVRFDTQAIPALQISMGERVKTGAQAIESGQMTINEARGEFLSMEPIDGIEGDVVLLHGKPVAQLLTEPAEPDDDNNLPAKPDKPAKGTALEELMTGAQTKFAVVPAKADYDNIVFSKIRATAEARLERTIRSVLRRLQQGSRSKVRSTEPSKMMADIEQIVYFDGRKLIVKELSASLRDLIDDIAKREGERVAQVASIGAFNVKPVRALARLTQQEQRIRNMMGRSWPDLRSSIAEGLGQGETTNQLKARVSKFFDGMRNNAGTIARTEVNAAVNGAAADVALEAHKLGVDIVSVWWTADDERVRGHEHGARSKFNHVKAHGLTIIPGEEVFTVSGETLEYPGDSWNGASAGNTINCRCGLRNEVRKPLPSDNRGEL